VTPPRRRYRTDLTDAQWQVLGSLIPQPKPGGRPAVHQRRELLNAMLYWRRAGCAWRLLPNDLPPWKTVYHYFRCWRLDGRWQQIVRVLRARERVRQGRRPTPSAAILDSQSVRTTERGAVRLRRRQEGQRPQAPPAGRHPGAAAGRAREPRQRQRPGWRCRAAGPAGPTPAAAAALWLSGRRLPRGIPGLGAGKVQDRLSGGGAR
jgi:transposase